MKLSARELELKAMRARNASDRNAVADRNAPVTPSRNAAPEASRNANAERQARWRAAQRAKRAAERLKQTGHAEPDGAA
jgi:hypothetical protein